MNPKDFLDECSSEGHMYEIPPPDEVPVRKRTEDRKIDDIGVIEDNIRRNLLKRIAYILERGGSMRDLEVLLKTYEVLFAGNVGEDD